MERLPELSVDLVKELDKLYPARCPNINDPDRKIWFDAGARAVVELLMLKAKQPGKRTRLSTHEPIEEEEE